MLITIIFLKINQRLTLLSNLKGVKCFHIIAQSIKFGLKIYDKQSKCKKL